MTHLPSSLSSSMSTGIQLPPLSLYIHVPWCVRKCPYCDFNSHQAPVAHKPGSDKKQIVIPEQDYVRALLADLDADLHWVQGRKIHSIFIGGGTPSLLSVSAYQQLFEGLKQRLEFKPDIEITLEANPGTFEAERFAGFRAIGINRLSIGVQSFNDEHLKNLGRIHDGKQAINAIKMARASGFDNFNIDLMHGLPGQSEQQALADIKQALALGPHPPVLVSTHHRAQHRIL